MWLLLWSALVSGVGVTAPVQRCGCPVLRCWGSTLARQYRYLRGNAGPGYRHVARSGTV